MNRNRIAIASLFAALAAAGAVQAQTFTDTARVRSVEPQYENVTVPRQQCNTQWVTEQRRVDNGRQGPSVGGTIIGGVAGGILGNQVGKGSGRDVATALGAAVGAVAGNHVGSQNRPEQYETVQRQVNQCQTVNEVQQRINGYRVSYDYHGQTYATVMPNDPGRQVEVRVSVEPVIR